MQSFAIPDHFADLCYHSTKSLLIMTGSLLASRYVPIRPATTTLLDDMTFPLPDVLEDLRSPADLRYQALLLLAQKYKRGIGIFSFVRADARVRNRSCVRTRVRVPIPSLSILVQVTTVFGCKG